MSGGRMAGGPAPEVMTVGETMASLRADGALRLGGTMQLSIAGSESTVAIGLARLGVTVGWAGVVGDDELGALILRTLRAEAVDVSAGRVDPVRPTGLMMVEPRLGQVTRVTYRRKGSAGSTVGAADVDAALALGPRWVHLSGITPALSDSGLEAVRRACSQAARAGARVSLDVNYRAGLWSRKEAAETLAPLAAQADLVLASADELDLVAPDPAGSTEGDQARALVVAGVSEVVVTRGAGGATRYGPDGVIHRPALAVTVVDTIGAGDAFAAGYLASLLEGADAATRLETAMATAAFAVSCPGDWEGLPTRRELPLVGVDPGASLR